MDSHVLSRKARQGESSPAGRKNVLLIYESNLMREMLEIVLTKNDKFNLLSIRKDSRQLDNDLNMYHVDWVILQYGMWNRDFARFQRVSDDHPETNFLAISSDAEKVYLKESIGHNGLGLKDLFGLIINADAARHSFADS